MDEMNDGSPNGGQSPTPPSAGDFPSPLRPLVVAVLLASVIIAGGLMGSALYLGDRVDGLRLQLADVGSAPGLRPQADERGQGQRDEPVKVNASDLVTANDPVLGPEDAAVTVVEFSDYQCPFCRRFFEQTFSELNQKYEGKIRYVFKDFPLPMHPEAPKAAEAAHCAGDQGKYWEMHGTLFRNQGSLGEDALKKYAQEIGLNTSKFNTCLSTNKYESLVEKNMASARSASVNGTPTFFINGERLVGAQPLSEFEKKIDAALKDG